MSERFLRCYQANAFFNCKTVEHKSRKSRDLLQTREFTVTLLCFFVVTAFSVAACVLLHFCSFVSHPSPRTDQRGIVLLDVVSEKKLSILARSVFVLHGHRLCRDIAVVLIASIAIWIPDILLSFYRETGNWRFTRSEIRRFPSHPGRVSNQRRVAAVMSSSPKKY